MELQVKSASTFCEVTIKSGNALIIEDVANINIYKADQDIVENFLDVYCQLQAHNKLSEIEIVKHVAFFLDVNLKDLSKL